MPVLLPSLSLNYQLVVTRIHGWLVSFDCVRKRYIRAVQKRNWLSLLLPFTAMPFFLGCIVLNYMTCMS
jgi:hypothetical protein